MYVKQVLIQNMYTCIFLQMSNKVKIVQKEVCACIDNIFRQQFYILVDCRQQMLPIFWTLEFGSQKIKYLIASMTPIILEFSLFSISNIEIPRDIRKSNEQQTLCNT